MVGAGGHNVFSCFETNTVITLAVVINEIQLGSILASSSFWRQVTLPSWAVLCTLHSQGPGELLGRGPPGLREQPCAGQRRDTPQKAWLKTWQDLAGSHLL